MHVFIWLLFNCPLLSHLSNLHCLSSKAVAWKLVDTLIFNYKMSSPSADGNIHIERRRLKCRLVTGSDYFPGCACELTEQEGLRELDGVPAFLQAGQQL